MTSYTIQDEASRIFNSILLADTRLSLTSAVLEASERTSFDSSTIFTPFLPAPLKCTESSTALWALLGTVGNAIVEERFGITQDCVVNSDIAALFLFSFVLMRVGGKPMGDPEIVKRYSIYDTANNMTPWRRLVTNVYCTRDSRWYHTHGSMNSDKVLRMLGLPENQDITDELEVVSLLAEAVAKYDAEGLDLETNEHWRQAGGIVMTPEEYRQSEHGEAVSNDSLYNIEESPHDDLPPVPWPHVNTNTFRPLEGIKLLDLTRAIAGPTMARLAALFGATVIRVSSTSMPDLGIVLFESNLGKRDVDLNLKTESGRAALHSLIQDADVVLDGYRPGALEKLGFGPTYVHEIAKRRGKGIVYARENCYGWTGPWAHRSGWQQVSDAVTGIGWLYGQMWDKNEPVMPFLPNSDFQTGIAGCIGIMNALDKRARQGGNYLVSTSLNAHNNYLISLGLQNLEVQRDLKEKWPEMKNTRHYDDLHRQMRILTAGLPRVAPEVFQPKYFQTTKAELGVPDEDMVFLGPAVTYGTTKLHYNYGSCLRGTHSPEWPKEDSDAWNTGSTIAEQPVVHK